jgi:hypothetical protein
MCKTITGAGIRMFIIIIIITIIMLAMRYSCHAEEQLPTVILFTLVN